MASATMSAARMLPSSRKSTAIDQQRALERGSCRTVSMVASTRSRAVVDASWPARPAGSDRFTSASRSRDALRTTVRLFSPISMMAVPTTTSSPLCGGRAGAQLLARARPRRRRCTWIGHAVLRRRARCRGSRPSVGDEPGGADEVLLAAVLDVAAADVRVVGGQRRQARRGSSARRRSASRDPASRGTAARTPPMVFTSVTPGHACAAAA